MKDSSKKGKRMKDCCFDNLGDVKHVSRAYWVCKECGKDVSILFVMLQETIRVKPPSKTKADKRK